MGIDFKRSVWERLQDMPITADIVEEGQLMVEAVAATVSGINFLEGVNQQAAAIAAGAANERPLGLVVTDALKATTTTVVENLTVPTVTPFSLQLRFGNVEAGSELVRDTTTPATLTETCPTPGAGTYCLTDATGVILFNAAEAGNSVTVQYRRALTVAEAIQLFGDRNFNNTSQDSFGHASLMLGYCRVFTSQYDSSQIYVLDALLEAGATGRFTLDGVGAGQSFGKVISVPTVDDPFLGVEYDTGSVTSIATP